MCRRVGGRGGGQYVCEGGGGAGQGSHSICACPHLLPIRIYTLASGQPAATVLLLHVAPICTPPHTPFLAACRPAAPGTCRTPFPLHWGCVTWWSSRHPSTGQTSDTRCPGRGRGGEGSSSCILFAAAALVVGTTGPLHLCSITHLGSWGGTSTSYSQCNPTINSCYS